jgi:energy-coupling factor transport system permease protein
VNEPPLPHSPVFAAPSQNAGDDSLVELQPLHTGALVLWLFAALLPTVLTRNPWYLALTLAAAGAMRRVWVRDSRAARTWGRFLRFGLVLGLVSLAFNLLIGGAGETPLLSLPQFRWQIAVQAQPVTLIEVGGPVTLEALIYGLTNAIALLTVLLALSTFNILVDHYQLLRRIPRFLDQSATVASIALTFVPELVRAQQEVREALALRGYRLRRLRDLPPLFVILLAEGLERSINLAESMEARGFSRRSSPGGRGLELLRKAAIAGALAMLAAGSFASSYWPGTPWGHVFMAAGVALLLGTIWRVGRGVRRSRYRREIWRRRDSVVAGASLVAIAALLTAWTLHRGLFVFNPYPKFARPPFDPVPVAALALLAAPVLAGARRAEERAP